LHDLSRDEVSRTDLNYDLDGAARALAAIMRARHPQYRWTVVRRDPDSPLNGSPRARAAGTADLNCEARAA